MTIEEHVSLKEFTTFKIGGDALYFVRVRNVEGLREALAFANEKKVPFFILGGGSNIVMSDTGFPGLVIKNEIMGVEVGDEENNSEFTLVNVGAGENWDHFVESMVNDGFYGIENLSAIPGTVGAAPVQNIGAYGAEVKNSIKEVEAFNTETGDVCVFKNSECAFDYRDSFFKTTEGKKYIITHVTFKLKKNGMTDISYRDVHQYFEEKKQAKLSLADVRKAVVEIRSKKLPDLNKYGTAGSFFKNPIIAKERYEELKRAYPRMPAYAVDETFVKVPLAWILDNVCGFKGYKNGNVGVYENQALVLVNFGGAKADEIKNLANEMMAKVKEATGIVVETEVQFV